MAMSANAAAINSTNVRKTINLAWQRVQFAVTGALAPERAIDAAMELFATPPRFAHTQRELELLSTAKRIDVGSAVGHLAAWRWGDRSRPAVILSHGWGGRGGQLAAFALPSVAAGYQVVTFDHVAHGASQGQESSLVEFVRGLDAVVRDVESNGARVAGIVGHSLGAAATGAWLNETGRAMRVVLVAPPTSVTRWSNFFARRLGIAEPIRKAMQERFERRYARRWADFELPQSVANVRAQALVIHDEDDRDVGFASGLRLARAWPDARLLATAGLGHNRILRDPQVIADAIDFIQDRVTFAPPPDRGEASAYRDPAPLV
jgi:pimeloyl-ACP methyl ester carboxylesterase